MALLDLDQIFDRYEDALKLQSDARERENRRIAAQQALTREAIGKCLREVVEPVLVEAREQMAARSYSCTVEYQQRVEDVGGEKLTWAVGIYLETPGGKTTATGRTPRLLFMGDVKAHAFVVEADHGRIGMPPERTHPVPISSFSTEFVGAQVKTFLTAVYQPPKV